MRGFKCSTKLQICAARLKELSQLFRFSFSTTITPDHVITNLKPEIEGMCTAEEHTDATRNSTHNAPHDDTGRKPEIRRNSSFLCGGEQSQSTLLPEANILKTGISFIEDELKTNKSIECKFVTKCALSLIPFILPSRSIENATTFKMCRHS